MTMKRWMKVVERPRPAKAMESQKAAIISACDAFIRDVLKPRFLPEIKPNEFNYAVDIFGDWRAGRYRFMQRFRSDAPNRLRDEFDRPFARLDFMGRIASTFTGCGTMTSGVSCIKGPRLKKHCNF